MAKHPNNEFKWFIWGILMVTALLFMDEHNVAVCMLYIAAVLIVQCLPYESKETKL